MQNRYRVLASRTLTKERTVALRLHMLALATMADAGDCKAFAANSPEVYRHGHWVHSIELVAADFSHPLGAAYVRVTGVLITQVRQSPLATAAKAMCSWQRNMSQQCLEYCHNHCHVFVKYHAAQVVLMPHL